MATTIVSKPQDENYLLLQTGGNLLLQTGGKVVLTRVTAGRTSTVAKSTASWSTVAKPS